jgi:hypothetical protein
MLYNAAQSCPPSTTISAPVMPTPRMARLGETPGPTIADATMAQGDPDLSKPAAQDERLDTATHED